MNAIVKAPAASRLLLSGNEAVARAVWESGVGVAAAYPGTPSTEILENLAYYPDIYAEWSVNEKVSMEVAIGASMAGSRAFCAMKHVGMNVASDAFMTQTLVGVGGGLVIAVADDVGLSSSQNEQDSRYWGRFGHMPILEPSDSQEAYAMIKQAFEISEQFNTPVIVRMTTRICHVKALVTVGERVAHEPAGFKKDPQRWVMIPAYAKARIPKMLERDEQLKQFSETTDLNQLIEGDDRAMGFVTSGPAFLQVQEAFPNSPTLKLGLSHPIPLEKIRAFSEQVDRLVVAEEIEPLIECELKAAGLTVTGKNVLPRTGELAANVLRPALTPQPESTSKTSEIPVPTGVFPRPPTMCVACPHLGVYFCLSRLRNLIISGDIGCYTLGAGHPWNALDATICMGASMGMALGLDKGRGESDKNKSVVAVIGDSTFLHMGMQGLLDITYNRGNVTILLLDNRTTGMTGGQENPGSGRDLYGNPAPAIDFVKLVEALGVKQERVKVVNPYELPTLFKALREETKINEPSVIITDQPCVLTDRFDKLQPVVVDEDKCTGCGTCLDVGCPAILVTRRDKEVKPSGKEVDLAFVKIETAACTGCNLCAGTCGPDAIIPA